VSALGFVLVAGLLVVLSWPTSDDDAATSGAGIAGASTSSLTGDQAPSANDGPGAPDATSLRAAEPLLGPAASEPRAAAAPGEPLEEIVLRGRVVDETGSPVGGATVICIPDSATQRQRGLVLFSAAADLSTLRRTTTDALGRFVLRDRGVLPGQTVADGLEASELAAFALPEARSAPFPCLTILTDRYAPAAHPCLGFESGEYDAGDIAVEPGGWLAGRAVDEAGRPVAGAAVVPQRAAFEPRHDMPRPDAMTGELLCRLGARVAAGDGRFELGPLWNGSAGLGLSAAWFRTTNGGPYVVSAGERLDVGDVVLRAGLSIAGFVVDSDGQPVAGARVYAGESAAREFAPDPKLDAALLDLRDFSLEAPVLTDRDGRFVVSTLAAGSQRLFVDAAHFELSLQFGLEPPLDGLRIELVRASTLELTVVDAGTDAPLAEATVAAVRRRRVYAPVQKEARVPVLAGQAAGLGPGIFRVERLGTQRTDLVVSAPGHEPTALSLEGVAPGTTLTREVRLPRGATIAGRVLDLDGGGLAGAVVTVMKTVDSTAAMLVALGYVGSAGKAKEKPPGFATDDAPTAALALATPARATSGDDGGYVLSGVASGPWIVRATLAGHQPSDRPVEVPAGARLDDVDLQMESGGVIFGTVTGSTGLLERGVLVRAKLEARPKAPGESRETYSDVNGEFELDELRPGTWSIGRGREGARQTVELAAGARLRVDIAAELVGTVSGRLLAEGLPIEGLVMARRAVDKPAAKDRLKVRTDATGNFQLQLLPGEWLLRGYGAEPAFGITESARVSVGARQAHSLDLALAGSAVSGSVTDAQSGEPIAGATVSLQTEGAAQTTFLGVPNPGGPKAPGLELWPRTDAQGRFVIPHVPADTYTAFASHPDYKTATREAVALGAGAATMLELTMTHTSGLDVTVKLPSGDPVPAGFTLLVTEVDGGTEIGKGVTDGVVEFIRLEPGTYNLYVFGPKPGSFKTGTSGEPALLEKQVALSVGERQAVALVVQP
jgi:protocatechuate 3,4-dioxygenase beta subunit